MTDTYAEQLARVRRMSELPAHWISADNAAALKSVLARLDALEADAMMNKPPTCRKCGHAMTQGALWWCATCG